MTFSDTGMILKWHVIDNVQQFQYNTQDFQYHFNDPLSQNGRKSRSSICFRGSSQSWGKQGNWPDSSEGCQLPVLTLLSKVTPRWLQPSQKRAKYSQDSETKALDSYLIPALWSCLTISSLGLTCPIYGVGQEYFCFIYLRDSGRGFWVLFLFVLYPQNLFILLLEVCIFWLPSPILPTPTPHP